MNQPGKNPGLWKLPRYGNRGKQSAFSLRSHSAGKTRPRTSSFPQLPQPLRLDIDHSKRHETLNKDAFIYEQ